MTKRRLFVLGSTIVWLVAMAAVVKTSVDRGSVPPWGNSLGDDRSAEIERSTHVGQQFTAPFPGLHRVQVALDPATAHAARRVTFHLKTGPLAQEDLWTADLSTSEVQDGVPHGFEFPPMRNSKGRTIYFYLDSPDSAPGDAITARYSPAAILDGASAYLDGQPVAGDLQFDTFYAPRTRDKIDLLLTRMAEGRPYLFGTKGVFVSLAAVYILTLGAFLWHAAQAVLAEDGL